MIEVRQATSVAEVMIAIDVLDRIFDAHEGWAASRDRSIKSYRADPALLVVALDDARVVGAVAVGPGGGGINAIGVNSAYRGQGIARRLLGEAEQTLRQRGTHTVGLGSVDDAVGFYLSCGYVPQLLVQFRPEADSPQRTVQELLAGQLRDHEVLRTEFRGSPQLWVQVDAVDFAFKSRIEAVATGTVAQYVMNKAL
jgi:GNAT superfamily N-acetyltransferase